MRILRSVRRLPGRRRALGVECYLKHAHVTTYGTSDLHLVGLGKKNKDILVGLYEMEDYRDGVLFKRVCDQPTREMLRLGKLSPSDGWPRKYEPPNRYGGSRKLPSDKSVGDLMVVMS